jgi:hypothetical protein
MYRSCPLADETGTHGAYGWQSKIVNFWLNFEPQKVFYFHLVVQAGSNQTNKRAPRTRNGSSFSLFERTRLPDFSFNPAFFELSKDRWGNPYLRGLSLEVFHANLFISASPVAGGCGSRCAV